jgi:DNA polymerase-3 subunit gamma/tau
MSQALYNKFRPHLWDQVVGQDHVVETLRNAIRGSRVGHAYLFAGPRGTGKTTTARLLAKAVNCLEEDLAKRPCDLCLHCTAVNDGRFLDLIEIDAASNTSVDDVRALREKINYSPSQGRFKVYLIDEVHMLSTAAFNALLKTLEEPPAHAIFILATTEVHKIPATVLSRCQRHEFRRIPVIDIVTNLKLLAGHEKITVEDESLTLIARQATGSMRDAISLFDQLASTGQDITLSGAQKVLGTAASAAVVSMVDAILSQQTGKGLDEIHHALDAGSDPRQFARQVVDYLRGLMLIRLGNADQVDVTVEMRDQMHQHARAYDTSRLMDAIRLFNSAASDTRSGWQPGLLLELALAQSIETAQLPATPTPQPVIKQVSPLPPARNAPVREAAPPPAVIPREQPPEKLTPASTPAPTPPVRSGNATAGINLQDVTNAWTKIRQEVRKTRPNTEALLNSGKAIAIKGNNLVMAFTSDVLKEKMESTENLDLTRQVIHQLLGVDLGIVCVVSSTKPGAAPPDLDVDSDGMVGTALNLGGHIVQKDKA